MLFHRSPIGKNDLSKWHSKCVHGDIKADCGGASNDETHCRISFYVFSKFTLIEGVIKNETIWLLAGSRLEWIL